ncbi:MAG: hypothetical protein MZW92_27320 [Comamonadaceae bacterium]|nr:hypothetical protein [Comamonadaceae bacterium]
MDPEAVPRCGHLGHDDGGSDLADPAGAGEVPVGQAGAGGHGHDARAAVAAAGAAVAGGRHQPRTCRRDRGAGEGGHGVEVAAAPGVARPRPVVRRRGRRGVAEAGHRRRGGVCRRGRAVCRACRRSGSRRSSAASA